MILASHQTNAMFVGIILCEIQRVVMMELKGMMKDVLQIAKESLIDGLAQEDLL